MFMIEGQELLPCGELSQGVRLHLPAIVHLVTWRQVGVSQLLTIRTEGRVYQVPGSGIGVVDDVLLAKLPPS